MVEIPVYNIDSGIPVPDDALKRSTQVPLAKLEVGESILFPLSQRSRVQATASKLKVKDGRQFTVKKMDEHNARVWRVQ